VIVEEMVDAAVGPMHAAPPSSEEKTVKAIAVYYNRSEPKPLYICVVARLCGAAYSEM
jgi:hypothetical protein